MNGCWFWFYCCCFSSAHWCIFSILTLFKHAHTHKEGSLGAIFQKSQAVPEPEKKYLPQPLAWERVTSHLSKIIQHPVKTLRPGINNKRKKKTERECYLWLCDVARRLWGRFLTEHLRTPAFLFLMWRCRVNGKKWLRMLCLRKGEMC